MYMYILICILSTARLHTSLPISQNCIQHLVFLLSYPFYSSNSIPFSCSPHLSSVGSGSEVVRLYRFFFCLFVCW